MNRRNLYVSGLIGASVSYIFNVMAFTGTLDFLRLGVFLILFVVVMFSFEHFIDWAETLED